MKSPLITIVTPSYNQSRYLEQTIRSVLAQDYPSIEYFVIDGGSTDSSVEIIQKYEKQLAGWVSEKDKGQAEAINKGFQRAGGEFIAWLNSDDLYQPGAVRQAIETFQKHPEAGLVYGDVLSIDENGQSFNLQTFQPFDLIDLMAFNIISQPAVFMRRSVLEQAGLLDPSYHLLLDHQLWLRMARLAPMVYIPETLAAARYHAEAKNLARTADFGREAFRIVDWMRADPLLAPVFEQNRHRILAGAHRLDAFYLLDGGLYGASLRAYGQAFRYNPPVVLREAHRVAYALLSLAGLARLRGLYTKMRTAFFRLFKKQR
ncbi:MAG: glycosyltransferase [Chloroflexi bacterium HGW-Chloroflexi-6]|nr:MAG: glycosyltransferase [Chloroflexi bacterium HGW-Chloroflexi-6]